ncbi:unnamed protein product, partial [marine sediment metagenome]
NHFKVPSGDCYYAWLDQTGEKKYILKIKWAKWLQLK